MDDKAFREGKGMRKTIWHKALVTVGLLAFAGLAGPSCADNESSFFIRACLVPDSECAVQATLDSATVQGGLVDTAFSVTGYRCPLLVGNQLAALGNDSLRTETSRIVVYALDITVADAASGGQVASYSVPAAGFVDPGQAPDPGYGVVDGLLLDVGTAQAVAAQAGAGGFPQVLVSVVARGRTLGGTELETAPWTFPITVCTNCTCTAASGKCTPDELTSTEADCRFGSDGRCRFVDTDCP